jgi:hypothetical protein
MTTNLPLSHKTIEGLCQWLPGERITRLRNLALLLVGLQQARGIHLSQMVNRWPGGVGKVPRLVNRLRRFLNNQRVEVRRWYEPLATLLVNQFRGGTIQLIIDGTKVGFNFGMLSISIAYKKRSLPLVWSLHRGRKGHVGYKAQLDLLGYVYELIGNDAEVWLLGDAGFESVHLGQWLTDHGWHFVLRHPGKHQVRWPGQPWVKLGDLPLQSGQTHSIGWVELTAKHATGPYWLTIHWAHGEDEPWFLLSDYTDDRTLIRLYCIRRWTEDLYGDRKDQGFALEATHLDDPDRIPVLCLPSGSILSGSLPLVPGLSSAAGAICLITTVAATRVIFVLASTGLTAVSGLINPSRYALLSISKLIGG